MRREPSLEAPEGEVNSSHDAPVNQGGLLSLSSISPQTSPPPPVMDAGGQDSARSTDSGMLPQRPTRRIIVKPDHVPTLDFSRLRIGMEEDEQEEELMEYDEAAEAEAAMGYQGQEDYEDGDSHHEGRGHSFLE